MIHNASLHVLNFYSFATTLTRIQTTTKLVHSVPALHSMAAQFENVLGHTKAQPVCCLECST